MQVPDDTECQIVTNRAWQGNCIINQDEGTITFTNVFSEVTSTGFRNVVTIELKGVINPLNNKEKGVGFGIITYADPD